MLRYSRMKAKLRLVFSITIFFGSFYAMAQKQYWKSISADVRFKSVSVQDISIRGKVFELDLEPFQKELKSASSPKNLGSIIYLPNGEGTIIAFKIWETPVFHPDLARKYPDIKSYSGQSLDNKYRVKLSSSQKGLQGMIVGLEGHKDFMEPVIGQTDLYVVYGKQSTATKRFDCDTEELHWTAQKTLAPLVDSQTVRKFRIAVSVSGEYTNYHGGTTADALAAINATLTRVNEVFETDLGVTLELVPNNDLVIFTDQATDPYTGDLNVEVQNTLTSAIGEANYDVGHLFHQVGEGEDNGNAGFVGAVCQNDIKGSAFSSAYIPEGDLYDIDYVAHELGHQFGANHTWSFDSEGTGVQAEPASGSTIMAYAGIVPGENVASNSDDYFHYNSILQITDYLETVACGESTVLSNSPPMVTPIGNFTIPKGTAFVLEGSATDSDVGDVLTYTWEQIDDGIVTTSTFGPENPTGANFRSLPPTTDPKRYFPKLSRVAQGNLTQTAPAVNTVWETVSNIQRDLNFAFTVRDNAVGGGQVVADLLEVNVASAAGPFAITSQNTNETYGAGSVQEVTWDVANTDSSPINTHTVDVLLGLDGGNTFPITLLEGTLNSGSAEVQMPGDATTAARIMVKASDNVFFAVNASDFTIEGSQMILAFQKLSHVVCQPDDVAIPFVYQTFSGFSETATFSADVPLGLAAAFSPAQASADDTAVTLTLSNTAGISPGVYPVTITAMSASVTKEVVVDVIIKNAAFTNVVLETPTDGALDALISAQFDWEADPSYTGYDIQIATDAAFSTIVESATVSVESYMAENLERQTTYFWRVRPSNECGVGAFGAPFVFTTVGIDCQTREAGNLPVAISGFGTSTVTGSIGFFDDLPISDINVRLELDHTWLSDLIIDLVSPSGTVVPLVSGACGSMDNINAVFDDDGTDIACLGNPAISGVVKPVGSLSSLIGESAGGIWTLVVEDGFDEDGGSLKEFSLEICAEGIFRPDGDGDGVFDDGDDLCLGTPVGVEVDTSGCPVNRLSTDNFLIEIQSETCRNNGDGSITITATNTELAYMAVLDGGEAVLTSDFSEAHTFQNLPSGIYSLCVAGTDGMVIYQEVCFDIVVSEPEILSVSTLRQQGILSLTMQGGSLYNVELNGLVEQTEDSEIQLGFKEGLNTLRVYTDLPCQGVYEDSFMVSFSGIVYPNPIGYRTKVFVGREIGKADIEVFSADGRLVMADTKEVDGNEFEMDFSALPAGTYYMKILGATSMALEFKMIKK